MNVTRKVRGLLSGAGVAWSPTKLFPETNTKVLVNGVELAVCENDNGTLKLVAYGLTPEQVVAVAKGGAA